MAEEKLRVKTVGELIAILEQLPEDMPLEAYDVPEESSTVLHISDEFSERKFAGVDVIVERR